MSQVISQHQQIVSLAYNDYANYSTHHLSEFDNILDFSHNQHLSYASRRNLSDIITPGLIGLGFFLGMVCLCNAFDYLIKSYLFDFKKLARAKKKKITKNKKLIGIKINKFKQIFYRLQIKLTIKLVA